MNRYYRYAGMVITMLLLNGCVGAAMHLVRSSRTRSQDGKPSAERIADAQIQAISGAQGGGPDTPIAWSEPKSGLQGMLVQEAGPAGSDGCHRYRQTIILNGQTLRGQLIACAQPSGSWTLHDEQSNPQAPR